MPNSARTQKGGGRLFLDGAVKPTCAAPALGGPQNRRCVCPRPPVRTPEIMQSAVPPAQYGILPPLPLKEEDTIPDSPPSPTELMNDVDWHLQNIVKCSGVDEAHTGYLFDDELVLRKNKGISIGRFSMEQVAARRLLSLCPVLSGSRKNNVGIIHFLALVNACSSLLIHVGGNWFDIQAMLFVRLDDMVYQYYERRTKLFAKFCACVSAGHAGDQQSMARAPGMAKVLLAESGREVCYTLHFMAGKIATFLRIHVKAQCGERPSKEIARNLQMVEHWAKKLRQVAVKEARVAVKWDRAAIEMAHAFGYDGVGVRDRLATVVPEYCVKTDMLLSRRLPVANLA